MALIQSGLSSALLGLTDPFPASYDEAGQRWANAYGSSYASAALSPTGGSPILGGAVGALASALSAAFATSDAVTAMTAALIAFWAGPPVTFLGTWPGVITTPPSGLDLASVFRANIDGKLSAKDSCDAIAAALHAFTLTAICTDTTIVSGVPVPVVGPIS